jgi:hypothetical protein
VGRVIIQDQAEWERWKGVLVLSEERLRFERPGLPPGNFVVCFDLPVTEINARTERSPRKSLVCNSGGHDYSIKIKNPDEWVKMLNVLRGR